MISNDKGSALLGESAAKQTINIYCDESCHLQNDGERAMVLGALSQPAERARDIAEAIRAVKVKHGLARDFEIKWSKVSPAKLAFYQDLITFFFEERDLSFRALVVPDKQKLDHGFFGQTHDTFYYKMYFDLLKVLLTRSREYLIYLDIKDTRSAAKTKHLRDVLCNNMHDFAQETVRDIQLVRSHHVEQVQLADLLIGAVAYANRGLTDSTAKSSLVDQIRRQSGANLTSSTTLHARKINIFCWQARETKP